MKTNVTLTRRMGNFEVHQRTKDGMFNATYLLKQWNESTGAKKELKDYFDNKSTTEFINAIIIEENLNRDNSPYLKTRGKQGGTWMHPLLFIDFAMWLNPSFKVKVLKFVYDELIKYRNEAGDAYNEMCSAVKKIAPSGLTSECIRKTAQALNFIVFGKHERDMRNKDADEVKIRELWELERKIAELINDDFIKSYNHLLIYLRNKWHKKNTPKILFT